MESTRFENESERLVYGKIGHNEWSFFVAGKADGRQSRVGAIYATKSELLSDLNRYASFYGFSYE